MKQVIQQFYHPYRLQYKLTPEQASTCQSILQCQTEALGGYIQSCDHCHYQQSQYCSCGNRHCPLCKQVATDDWLKNQQKNLLPVSYYHTVFTLPHEFNTWVRLHPEEIYQLFFRAVWETLAAFAMQSKHHSGQLGVTSVLHTWGQNLSQHVHLHCLIPGIKLSNDKQDVKLVRGEYLYPIKALQRKYRGKFVSLLREAYQSGKLFRITRAHEIKTVLDSVMKKTWVIYIKPYLKNPETILNYLSRYTYKIAISNQRLLSVNDKTVKFRYQDYRDGQQKAMSLDGVEFLRRFLQHVLPKGFMRVRHYGFLANSVRKKRLVIIRQLLKNVVGITFSAQKLQATLHPELICPRCHQQTLRVIAQIKKVKRR